MPHSLTRLQERQHRGGGHETGPSKRRARSAPTMAPPRLWCGGHTQGGLDGRHVWLPSIRASLRLGSGHRYRDRWWVLSGPRVVDGGAVRGEKFPPSAAELESVNMVLGGNYHGGALTKYGAAVYCSEVIARVASSFVFLLVLLTVLGHACELPIGAVLAAHAHDDAQDAAHHHPGDSEAACDAVLAVQRTAQPSPQPHAVLHAPAPLRIGPLEPLALSAVARESHAVRRGPPLFLLHSALLI